MSRRSNSRILQAKKPASGCYRGPSGQLGQPVRVGLGVVVQQGYQVAGGAADALVAGDGEAVVLAKRFPPEFRIALRYQPVRAVGRAVVHHQHLEVPVALGAQRLQAAREVAGPVPVGDDDRYGGRGVRQGKGVRAGCKWPSRLTASMQRGIQQYQRPRRREVARERLGDGLGRALPALGGAAGAG